MAAQVTANGANIEPANDSLEPAAAVATGIASTGLDGSAAVSIELDNPQPGSIDTSASQRATTLRDINQATSPPGASPTPDPAEAIVMSGDSVKSESGGADASVDSFEDQMNVSMTQTMQALNVRQVSLPDDDDDDDDESKKGFFSRFRRK